MCDPRWMDVIKPACLVVLCLLMAGCGAAPKGPTAIAPSITRPVAPPTPTDVPYAECIWSWASRPLPELSAQAQAALEAAGIERVDVAAEAFGEECLDPRTHEVNRFAARQTDFRFTVRVDDVADREAMGNLAARLLAVLEGFAPESTPGPVPGQVGIEFIAGGEALHLWFTHRQAEEARRQNLGGAALLDALQKP